MNESATIGRRAAVVGALAPAGFIVADRTQDGVRPIRWSTGPARSRTKAPPNATDCHCHSYDGRDPAATGTILLPEGASPEDHRALWAGSEARLHRIPVDNPARLHGFRA